MKIFVLILRVHFIYPELQGFFNSLAFKKKRIGKIPWHLRDNSKWSWEEQSRTSETRVHWQRKCIYEDNWAVTET
jgi:hypothetical protein